MEGAGGVKTVGSSNLDYMMPEAYIPNLGLLLCLKPSKKFSVVVVGVQSDFSALLGSNLKLWFWPKPKMNNSISKSTGAYQ